MAGLTPLYRTSLLRAMPATIPMAGYSVDDDLEACRNALYVLEYATHDHSDLVRRRVFQDLMRRVFGNEFEEGE